MLPDALKETILQLWHQAVVLSDDLHAHPELGLNEVQTAAFIEAKLDEWHIPHHRVFSTSCEES